MTISSRRSGPRYHIGSGEASISALSASKSRAQPRHLALEPADLVMALGGVEEPQQHASRRVDRRGRAIAEHEQRALRSARADGEAERPPRLLAPRSPGPRARQRPRASTRPCRSKARSGRAGYRRARARRRAGAAARSARRHGSASPARAIPPPSPGAACWPPACRAHRCARAQPGEQRPGGADDQQRHRGPGDRRRGWRNLDQRGSRPRACFMPTLRPRKRGPASAGPLVRSPNGLSSDNDRA